MWKRMIRAGVIAIVLPFLILITLVAMNTIAVHYYCAWPLILLELTGVMGASPEGFYNEWYSISVMVSLGSQASTIFLILVKYLTKREHT
jgi:hypothetical protein